MRSTSWLGVWLTLLASTGSAAVLTQMGNGADQLVATDGSLQYVSQTSSRVGAYPASPANSVGSFIFVFQLPTVDVGLEQIVDANLQFHLRVNNAYSAFNADLYGLRYSASSAVAVGDYYFGLNDAGKTKIQDNILYPTVTAKGVQTPSLAINTSSGGAATLATWITSLYQAGAVAGNYAFLRLNVDANTGNNNFYYEVETANSGTPAYRPVLTLETAMIIPEPGTASLIFVVGFLLIAGHRHFRRSVFPSLT